MKGGEYMQRKFIVSAIAVVAAGGVLFTTVPAFAQTSSHESLVQAIASKFGLNVADVQSVFDQHKSDMRANMEAKVKERLDQAVKDGKLTAAQEQLVLDKRKELEAKRQSDAQNFKSMTKEERKTAMDQEKTDLENWAKQNNIDLKYLMPGGGMGRGLGHWK